MEKAVNIRCRAVLFDMDGTLVDSRAVVEEGWRNWAARHGFALETVLAFSHGRPALSTMEHFLPGEDHRRDLEEHARFERTEFGGIVAVPGAAQLLRALDGHPWAVVTSAWRKLAEARISAAGLPLPRVIVPVDEISQGKPDPEGFLLASEQLGIEPRQCLVFEDTRPGIDAGLRAGMQVVGLLTTVPALQLKHDVLIRDFRDATFLPDGDSLSFWFRNQLPD